VELGRGQDEPGVRRRLLERLQQRVEGLGRQHVDFVEDRDAEAVALRRVADRLDQLPRVLDLAVGRAVHLMDVEGLAAVEDLAARRALAAGLDCRPFVAVQGAGEHPCRRGLPDPARPRQKVRRRHPALGDGVGQRARDGLLADQVFENAGAPLAGQSDVHRDNYPAAEDELRLTCGARGRLLIAASFRT
jgi:hypothetical protein